MKKLGIVIAALAIAVLVGCGKDGGQTGATPQQPPIQPGSCQSGYIMSQYGCLPQNGCPSGQGFYNGQCVGGINTAVSGLRMGASLTITNRPVFEKFLEMTSYGRCRLNSSGWGWGPSYYWYSSDIKCSNYSAEGYLIITGSLDVPTNGSPYQVLIGGGARVPLWAQNIYGGVQRLPIEANLRTAYKVANQNQGFALEDGAQFSYPYGRVRVIALTGSLASDQVSVVVEYEGQEFARTQVSKF